MPCVTSVSMNCFCTWKPRYPIEPDVDALRHQRFDELFLHLEAAVPDRARCVHVEEDVQLHLGGTFALAIQPRAGSARVVLARLFGKTCIAVIGDAEAVARLS